MVPHSTTTGTKLMKQEFNLDEAALAEFTARFALQADAATMSDDEVAQQELCVMIVKKATLPL